MTGTVWRAFFSSLLRPFIHVAALVVSWFGGRASARADAEAAQNEVRLEAVKEANEVRDEVEALDRDALKRRASVWVRRADR